MLHLKFLIAMLPVVFMLHDFEEIIMFKPWLIKNREELKSRFPKFENFLTKRSYFEYSTSAFAVAVMNEFALISLVTFCSLYFDVYDWWFAAFMAYSIHLFVHLGQWIIYRKYVPVIVTTVLTFPYCIYTFCVFINSSMMHNGQMLLWTAIGVGLTILSFFPAFYFASIFEKWKRTNYLIKNK